MTVPLFITGLATLAAVVHALGSILRKRRSLASWFFCAGMLVLAADALLGGMVVMAGDLPEQALWLRRALAVEALIPGVWLAFSLTYSRGNGPEFLQRWWVAMTALVVIPLGLVAGGYHGLVELPLRIDPQASPVPLLGPGVKILSGLVLLASVLILINLEKTIRSAVGTERWRVKFVFLGLGMIFGTRVYTGSMALLYHHFDPALVTIEQVSLLIGCGLMGVAYFRRGFRELEIYPSRSVLQGSVTLLLAGAYLTVVGLLAQGVSRFGGKHLSAQAFIILIGLVGLAVLLLSDRLRTGLQRWVARHFKRPEHDFRDIWTNFTRRTSGVMDAPALCRATAGLVAETFDVLNVVAFLRGDDGDEFVKAASTAQAGEVEQVTSDRVVLDPDATAALLDARGPINLDRERGDWARPLRELLPSQFSRGGHRMLLPLSSGTRPLGFMILADRVNGIPYSFEETELLACIGDQLAAALLNRTLTEQVLQARELEAFQTMSTFFVHDLKNAANSLALMIENLPKHFEDPEFRQDALRMIGKTADRINGMILRLSSLRGKMEISPAPADLNDLVDGVLRQLGDWGGRIERGSAPLPPVPLDREQIESVVTNLIVNAREACGADGTIHVETRAREDEVVLEVRDDGCGMNSDFVEHSLFRPFFTTKSKGLGIGMFQCKMIIEAHRGGIHVRSTPGRGSSFRVVLPLGAAAD